MSWKKLYIAYNIVFHLLITIGYPVHLGLALFRNGNLTDDIRNLTFFTTYAACSVKFIIYAYNFDKVRRMKELLKLLDSRVNSPSDMDIYNQLKAQLKIILYAFIGICLICATMAELAFILQDERVLLYPAWLPFDWRNSSRNFYIANVYQIVGSCYQLLQNYVNDCFPVVMLCIISAHSKMLYLRIEQIGVMELEDAETQTELEACITDHKRLLKWVESNSKF